VLVEFHVAGDLCCLGRGTDLSDTLPILLGLHQEEGDAFYVSLQKKSQEAITGKGLV